LNLNNADNQTKCHDNQINSEKKTSYKKIYRPFNAWEHICTLRSNNMPYGYISVDCTFGDKNQLLQYPFFWECTVMMRAGSQSNCCVTSNKMILHIALSWNLM